MVRSAGIMKVYKGKEDEYIKRHNEIWPELVKSMKEHGGSNYSIFLNRETGELFSYLEIESEEIWNKREGDALTRKWWDYMADLMETNPDNSPVFIPIEEAFHLD